MSSKRNLETKNLLNNPTQRNAALIRDCTSIKPVWAVLPAPEMSFPFEAMREQVIFPVESLYGFEPPVDNAQAAQLVLGKIGSSWVVVFQGLPSCCMETGDHNNSARIRLAYALGARNVVIANTAGADYTGETAEAQRLGMRVIAISRISYDASEIHSFEQTKSHEHDTSLSEIPPEIRISTQPLYELIYELINNC